MRAAILAGGASRRMGRPKAVVALAGLPLISYPVAAARAAGLEVVVVAKPGSALPPLDVPVIEEPAEPVHPLAGIVAALDDAPVVAVGCDMPFVSPELLAWLGEQPEPLVVPCVGGRLQPLLARYSPELRATLEPAAARGEPAHEAIAALGPRILERDELVRFGDPARLFFNVNTPDDLARAEEMLAR